MKKILIYINEDLIKPIGGPFGYNYNLKIELDKLNYRDIEFLPPSCSKRNNLIKLIKKYTPNYIKNILFAFINYISIRKLLSPKIQHIAAVDINKYALIHFHGTSSLYSVRDSLKNYTGKVILTSHSPTLASIELYDSLSNWEKKIFGSSYKKLKIMDEYAFNRADYLVFPCEFSREPYIKHAHFFSNIKPEKFKYLLTGIPPIHCKKGREEILNSLNIPLNSNVICYVGRHNEIKGYDILIKIGRIILNKYPNVYFLILGTEGPIKKLDHKRWIEFGWSNDPHSFIGASDLFILPNRETYFDLIVLEVLAIGVPIVCSSTGGNKYFQRFKESGIFLYEDFDECIKITEKLINLDKQSRNRLGQLNKSIYQRNFTSHEFAKRYIELLNSML